MIAIVLAAGKGTRLSSFYSCSSKCMIPFEGKPLIERTLNNLLQCNELSKIYIIIQPNEEEIPKYLGTEYCEIPIEYCFQDQKKPGIINAIYSVKGKVNFQNEDIIINLGDEYYERIDYNSLIIKHRKKNSSVTPVVVYCEEEEEIKKNYTVNIAEDDKIIDAVEKPLKAFNNYIGTGIIVISGEILKEFALYCKNNFKDKQLVDFMKYAISIKKYCYVYKAKIGFCNLNYKKDLEYLYTISYNPTTKTINKMFSEVVNSYPDRIAIRDGEKNLTFKMLDKKSDMFALSISSKNFEAGECAAIKNSDPIETIIEIMGILKAGGYYVILGKNYSEEIIEYIIKKANIKIIIDNDRIIKEVTGIKQNYNSYREDISSEAAILLFNKQLKKFNTITKKAIVNLASSMKEFVFDRCKKDLLEIGMISELEANYSIQFLYSTLLNGCTLNIIPKSYKFNVENFIFKLNKMDICETTSYLLSLITEYIDINPEILLYTKILMSSNEVLSKQILHSFFQKCALTDIINVYGKDECAIQNTMFYINKKNEKILKEVSIGKPIRNTRIYILDSDKKILGVNKIGDIWIAGDGVSVQNYCKEKLEDDIISSKMKMFNTCNKGFFGFEGNIYLK